MRLTTIARFAAILLLGVLPQRAAAQFTTYTDLAAFLAATTGAGTDSFDDLSLTDVTPSPLVRTAGAFGYTATVNTTSFFGAGAPADRWLSTNTATDIVTFSGFGSGVRGVGGLFFGSDVGGAFRPGSSIILTAFTMSGRSSRTVVDATLATFIGFVAQSDILSFTVEAVQPLDGSFAWPTVNDFVLAGAPVADVVPEPATWTMMVLGFGMLVLVVARRRTSRIA